MLLLYLIYTLDQWTLTDLDLYDALSPMHVAMDGDGGYFIADMQQALIHHVSGDGKAVVTFGGRGQGPGEMFSILCIQFFDGKLYVFDQIRDQMSVFSDDDKFIKKIRAPSTAPNGWYRPIFRSKKGWLVLGHKVIRLMSESFDEESTFLGDLEAEQSFRNKNRKLFNPTPDVFRIAFDQVKKRIVVYVPGEGFQLRVFSLDNLEQIGVVRIPGKLVPFDQNYGKERLENWIANSADRPWFLEGTTLNAPEYFPPIFMLGALPTGEFDVILGNPLLPIEKRRLFLDQKLQIVNCSIFRKEDVFVLAAHGDRVLIRYPGKEGQLIFEQLSMTTYLDPEFKRPK